LTVLFSMTNPRIYYRPTTLEQALDYLQRPGSVALSGGAFLLGGLDLPYDTVVDLQDIAALRTVERARLGGAAMLQMVVESPDMPDKLKDSITRTLPLNRRIALSVGESLTVENPPREWLALLAVLDAEIEHSGFRKAESGFTRTPVEQFIADLNRHGFPYQGLLLAVHLPPLSRTTRLGAAFVARTPADWPIVNAAVRVDLDDNNVVQKAMVALGGVSPLPVMKYELATLAGQPLSDSLIESAARSIADRIVPVADYRGSVEYRREMGAVMVKRALINTSLEMR
jgi:CO/xanthine dehydrogenase FAD-binding subunit